MAFLPIAKFAALAMKQISKPIAKALTARAQRSPGFSTWLESIGRGLHNATTWTNRTALGLDPTSSKISTITREKAVADGSEFLGEGVLFGIAVLVTGWEYKYSSDKANQAKLDQLERERILTERVSSLENALEGLQQKLSPVALPSAAPATYTEVHTWLPALWRTV